MAPAPRLFRIPEAALLLSCSERFIYDLIYAGRIPTVNIGIGRSKTRIREDDLAAYIAKQTSRTKRGVA